MNKKKIILLIIAGLLIVSIPLTVFIAQQQQEIRQRAATPPQAPALPSLYFTIKDSPTPIHNLSLSPKQEVSISLYLNPENIDINGFDIGIKLPDGLKITNTQSIEEESGAKQFSNELFNKIDHQNNTVEFSKISSNTEQAINGATGDLNLLTIPLKAGSENATAAITIPKAEIISPTNIANFLALAPLPSLTFTIQAPTPTPTPLPGSIVLDLSFTLEGIRANRKLESNIALSQVTATLEVLKDSDKSFASAAKGTVEYDPQDGKFKGAIDIGNKLEKGKYTIAIKVPAYLKRRIPKTFPVEPVTSEQQPIQTIEVSVLFPLPAGDIVKVKDDGTIDIGSDGKIDIADYNALTSCFGAKRHTSSCTLKEKADLNFDGGVDGIDYNMVLRNFGKTDD